MTCEKLCWSRALGVPRPRNLKSRFGGPGPHRVPSPALGPANPTPLALRGGWYPRCFSLHPQPSQVVTARGGHLQLLTLGLLCNCVVRRTSTTHADLQTAEQGAMDRLERGLTGAENRGGGGEGAVELHLPLARFAAPPALLEVAAASSCDPGQIILFFWASVSPPTSRGSNSSQS